MNGKVISAILVTAVLAIAMVPAMADDAEGDKEYGPMEIHFYDKEGGRIILIYGMIGPDFVVSSGIPSVKGSYGWSIYGVEYPGRDLVGTSLKVYASTKATYANPVVLDAYPMFDDPSSSAGEGQGDSNSAVLLGLAATGIIVLVLMAALFLGDGGRGRGSDPYDRFEPYNPWYKRP